MLKQGQRCQQLGDPATVEREDVVGEEDLVERKADSGYAVWRAPSEQDGGAAIDPETENALAGHFLGRETARRLFDAVLAELSALGEFEVKVTRSQVAFARRHNVAVTWTPDRYLDPARSAPLVLSFSFHHRDPSPRWKEVVATGHGRYTHHLELFDVNQVDDDVRAWLAEAWEAAG